MEKIKLFIAKNAKHILLFIFLSSFVYSSYRYFVPVQQVDDKLNVIKVDKSYLPLTYAYISGAVERPGVYEVDESTILIDLLNKAGGFRADADFEAISKNINLAQRVFNEDHFFMPVFADESKLVSAGNTFDQGSNINLNTATSEQLQTLPGIGPSTAQKIIDGRPYKELKDLLSVKGIGESTLDKIGDRVTVN